MEDAKSRRQDRIVNDVSEHNARNSVNVDSNTVTIINTLKPAGTVQYATAATTKTTAMTMLVAMRNNETTRQRAQKTSLAALHAHRWSRSRPSGQQRVNLDGWHRDYREMCSIDDGHLGARPGAMHY